MPKIKIENELYARLKAVSATAGYASAEEFIHHVLEIAAGNADAQTLDPDIAARLKGLGYIG